MGFSRQREQSEHLIKSKVNIFKKIICVIFTLLMWTYSALACIIFATALFNYNNQFISILKISLNINNTSIIKFLLLSILLFIIDYLLLTLWKIYNKKRYGGLNRRKYPTPTTDDEMLSLKLVDNIDYEILQDSKVSTFLTNPIRELNCEDKAYV